MPSITPTSAIAVDPFKMHPPPRLTASSSAPLTAMSAQDTDPKLIPRKSNASERAVVMTEVDEINKKVNDMLAATDVLKPPPVAVLGSPSFKKSRFVAKMSSAWDKFHTKATSPDPQAQGLPHPWNTASPLGKPVETLHIRLNESDNLNRKKVQKIFGNQITRKPVPGDRRSLRSGKSTKSQSAGVGLYQVLKTINYPDGMDLDLPPPDGPFLTENWFESDLEYRILNSEPDGSSTPRQHIDATDVAETGRFQKQHPLNLHHVPESYLDSDTEMDYIGRVEALQKSLETVGNNSLVAPGIRLDHHAANPCRNDHGSVKKHPSPDKQYLENLEVALQKYKKLKMSGCDDTALNELADTFPPPRSLDPRDSNRLIAPRNTSYRGKWAVIKARQSWQSPVSPRHGSRIPRPPKTTVNHGRGRRLASDFRPDIASVDDMDELL